MAPISRRAKPEPMIRESFPAPPPLSPAAQANATKVTQRILADVEDYVNNKVGAPVSFPVIVSSAGGEVAGAFQAARQGEKMFPGLQISIGTADEGPSSQGDVVTVTVRRGDD